jgi:hypothetical protein
VSWLLREGIVDGELAELLAAAEHEDFTAALELYDALGRDRAALEQVYEFLGREIPEPVEPAPADELDALGNPRNPVLPGANPVVNLPPPPPRP